jgi:death-on-curing protein
MEIYNDLRGKAASLLYEILKLHPFLDGNKRTGYEATDVFLRLNGYFLDVKQDDAVKTTLTIAECSMNLEQTSSWVKNHTKRVPVLT